ncbi:MAG TPA: DPP IV N-terminal domain-containing protein [Vicinamibacterales bacterium]|jgi:dipeptidyl aminopeptidase/acylaminoacyl peptidase|nr:DPP IV N-terminal domain-containing protein [Vicinamibacterales bacterium]
MNRSFVAALGLAALATGVVTAQNRRVLTTADYDRAVKMLAPNLTGLVVGDVVNVNWLPDGRFWYTRTTSNGNENIVIDPVKKTRDIVQAPPPGGQPSAETAGRGGRGGGGGRGGRGGGRAGVTLSRTCGPNATGMTGPPPASMSPDGKKAVFICDWNLWVKDVASGQERQLTTDGVKDFGYATSNAGWATSAAPALSWSPDSRKIATQQQDERKVGDMYLVETPVNGGHPVLRAWKYPLPGDPDVAMISRVVIDVDTGKIKRLLMKPDFHRGMSEDNIDMTEYLWSPDGSQLGFVSTDRFHKTSTSKVVDTATGEIRTLFAEAEQTHVQTRVQWQILWDTREVVWYSQRDGTANMYLYDLDSGKLKNQITTGAGPVTRVDRIDRDTRTMWYEADGREKDQDPYFTHLYRVGLDGRNNVSLTPDNGTHGVQISPDGKYVVDTFSQPDVAPETVLRDGKTGALIMPLEKADISKLLATGWKPPMQIKMKAADGKTDIYGMLFRPTNFDPSKKYPIINNAYPGPQSGSVGSRAFTVARGDKQALAELGFVVVSIDGTGTPNRSKAFTDAYYGAMGRHNTIPDQIAGMKELAQRYPWIDIDKAAMWGHSGGGFITADALLRAPYNDFFKVGIAESGNHDQRQYEDDWGERYQGPLVKNPDGTDNYAAEATQNQAAGLKGHLLLIHGTMDNNVPPYNTLLVADALIKANKEFDMLLIPNSGHGYTPANYVMRRRWDYFVKYLLDAEPPRDYVIPAAPRGRAGAPGGGE